MKLTYLKLLCLLVFLISLALGIHNAGLYDPTNGFDGSGHVYYVEYIAKNFRIPPPTEWETHQPPLYYLASAAVLSVFRNVKSIQYINIFVFWMIIAVVGLGLNKIFKDRRQVLLGMFSLVALPMLNIFLPTVTNELLNTFWILSTAVACLYLYTAKSSQSFTKSFVFLLLSLVLGVWTKITIITILPTVFIALFLSLKSLKKFFVYSVVVILVFVAAYTPIYLRAGSSQSPSNITLVASHLIIQRSPEFYYRLDWIPKVDMYTTQYYSFLGGAWNSFWSDGHNVITPFVTFHKKALILWLLGFVLLPLSLYGFWKQFKENRKVSLVMATLTVSMWGFYLLLNMVSNHYSAVRLTYQMGIVLPYAFGISAAAKNKKLWPWIALLLIIQFVILISFFWIQPWWFVTRPKAS